MEVVIVAALAESAAHLGAVRHFIDAQAHARGQRPPIAVSLPKDPRLQHLSVRSQPLSDYEQLAKQSTTDEHTDHDSDDGNDPHA